MPKAGQHEEPQYRWGFWALSIIASLLAFSLIAGPSGYGTVIAGEKALLKRSTRAYQLIEENARLRRRLDGLRSDAAVLEEEARDALRLVQPDELVLLISSPIDADEATMAEPATPNPPTEPTEALPPLAQPSEALPSEAQPAER